MKISVVIPCYNSALTIEETLESVLAQTYLDFEVIAVDDGSQDDTALVLEKYKERVNCVYQDNAGVSAARNNGVACATGEWIAFCDSDDLWRRDKLEVIAAIISSMPLDCDLLFSDYAVMDDGVVSEARGMMSTKTMFPVFREFGVRIEEMFAERASIRASSSDGKSVAIEYYYGHIFKWLILGNIILPSAVVLRKDAYERIGGFNGEFRNAEDTEFFLRLSKHSNLLYVDEPLIIYRRISTSLLATSMLKTMRNGARSVEINCKEDPQVYSEHKATIERSLARKYARLAYFYLSELDPRNAFEAATTSLKYRKTERLAWTVLLGSMVPKSLLGFVRKSIAARKR